jgi:REP element-mobilizing transposase RayT
MYSRRKRLRLPGYDYSQPGYYFVTISSNRFKTLFGTIAGGKMRINEIGKIVLQAWQDLPNHYLCHLDAFVLMPNHIHGIVIIDDTSAVRAGLKPARTAKRHGLSEIMRGFKTFSARRINEYRGTPGQHVWHRSFYDRVIRREEDVEQIRAYILQNPQRWAEDSYNPNTHKNNRVL